MSIVWESDMQPHMQLQMNYPLSHHIVYAIYLILTILS